MQVLGWYQVVNAVPAGVATGLPSRVGPAVPQPQPQAQQQSLNGPVVL